MEKHLSTLTQSQQQFVSDSYSRFGRTVLTHQDHATMLNEGLVQKKQGWFFGSSTYRISSGKFELPIEKVTGDLHIAVDVDSAVVSQPPVQEVVQPKSLVRDHYR